MGKDLYEPRNSNYCYPGTDVLVNKLNIKDKSTLQKFEAKITAAKLLALRQKGIIGNFDAKHLNKYIHIFLKTFILLLVNIEMKTLQKAFQVCRMGIYRTRIKQAT